MLNCNFSEKGLGLISPPHFVYDFSRKMFLCYILLTDQISLSDCLYFLRYCERKELFIIFKGLSVAKNCLRRESAPLKRIVF